MADKKKPGKKKLLILIAAGVLILLLAGAWFGSAAGYNSFFGKRFEIYEPTKARAEYFDGLEQVKYEIPSDKGQKLAGFLYSAGENQKGIIILAHGFGAGSSSYINCADYFAKRGYYVFAYDATGCEESEGESLGGFPQGIIDLDRVITFVEESGNLPKLPIGLFGHSWGAYCVSAVAALHPEVKAIIACSGFNQADSLFREEGKNIAGPLIDVLMPVIKLYERTRFGEYATMTAEEGFAATDAKIMIVHSTDDETVDPAIGYDIYYRNHKDDPRFTFIRYENRGHNYLDTRTDYMDEVDEAFRQWVKTLDYDPDDEASTERFVKDKAEYIRQNVDLKAWWAGRIDEELYAPYLAFLDEHVK